MFPKIPKFLLSLRPDLLHNNESRRLVDRTRIKRETDISIIC